MTKSDVASRLMDARKRAGLTQAQLAERLRTSQSAVARAESGYRMPRIEFVDRWARATGTQIPLVFGGPELRLDKPAKRRALVRQVLGPGLFNPWDRKPSKVEADLLNRAGLTKAHFRRLSGGSGKRAATRS